MKTSWEEQVVGMAIKNLINDEIGYRENSFLDGNYADNYDVADFMAIVEDIVNTMMTAKKLYTEGSSGLMITKEVRFLGKVKVRDMVTSALLADYLKDRWIFPHKELDSTKIIASMMEGSK